MTTVLVIPDSELYKLNNGDAGAEVSNIFLIWGLNLEDKMSICVVYLLS